MKKLMACMLAVVMVLSMSISAFASSYTPSVEYKDPPGSTTSGSTGVGENDLLTPNDKVSPETGVEDPMGMMVAAVALMGTAVVLSSKSKR